MRKFLSSVLCLILPLMLLGTEATTYAAGLNITDKFTDPEFKSIVYQLIGKTPGSSIYTTDVAGITEFGISFGGRVTVENLFETDAVGSLAGIEYFTSLAYFQIDGQPLSSLDLSKNKALITLHCGGNYNLQTLNVSGCAALEILSCAENKLTSLDVSKNTALQALNCGSPYEGGNLLVSLNVSKNLKLEALYCANNQLTSLDVGKNTKLEYLYCNNNQLTSLDLSKNPALIYLDCSYNNLSADPVGIGSLHLEEYTFIPQNTKTDDISDQFTDENFKAAVYEIIGKAPGSPIWPADVADIPALYLNGEITDWQIKSLNGIEYFTGLQSLNCSYNFISSLDLSKNTALTTLDCRANNLTALDVSQNTALTHLTCWGNQLKSLDVSKNTKLEYLHCGQNQLTELDVSNNLALSFLNCSYNFLAGPPAGLENLRLSNYEFDPQWKQGPESPEEPPASKLVGYLVIGGGVVLVVSGAAVAVVLFRKKKKAAQAETIKKTR